MTRSTREHRQAAELAQLYLSHQHKQVAGLARSVCSLAKSKEQLDESVLAARKAGVAWNVIGRVMGVSTNSAWSQYRDRTDEKA